MRVISPRWSSTCKDLPQAEGSAGAECTRTRPVRWLGLLLVCLLGLAGCDRLGRPETLLDEYLIRLGRVLDEPVSQDAAPLPMPLPLRRERQLAVPEMDIGILDFLALLGCDVQYLIGERNSSLGRVMHPFNRLDYDLRFIASAQRCITQLPAEDRMRETLIQAIRHKHETLPIVAWNATWGSQELGQFFSLSRTAGEYPLQVEADLLRRQVLELQAWNALLVQLREPPLPEDAQVLNGLHPAWQAAPLGGQLLRSAQRTRWALNAGTQMLQARLARAPLCLRGQPNPGAEHVRSLFMNIYIGRVQPYLAQLQRARQALMPLLRAAHDALQDVSTPAMRAWVAVALEEGHAASPDALWVGFDQAIRAHTEAWQQALAQCGWRPGTPPHD